VAFQNHRKRKIGVKKKRTGASAKRSLKDTEKKNRQGRKNGALGGAVTKEPKRSCE